MRYSSKIVKTSFLSIVIATISAASLPSYADTNPSANISVDNLIGGYGRSTLSTMVLAPKSEPTTRATNLAQETYLLSPQAPLVGPLTQELLIQLANLNDTSNNQLSLTWNPDRKTSPAVTKEPLKSVDISSLLQPLSYDETEAAQAANVINALSGSLAPINTLNFNQLVANLSGNKDTNLKVKLQQKQIQEYLAALRSYLATQTVALTNLYQLYTERQAIDPSKANPALRGALKIVASQTSGPLSMLKLENFMATRRILNDQWHTDLIHETPATLQREQVELLAENLAESYQTRMTLERLLATMSVLVLEFNGQVRTQLQNQIQNINANQAAPTG